MPFGNVCTASNDCHDYVVKDDSRSLKNSEESVKLVSNRIESADSKRKSPLKKLFKKVLPSEKSRSATKGQQVPLADVLAEYYKRNTKKLEHDKTKLSEAGFYFDQNNRLSNKGINSQAEFDKLLSALLAAGHKEKGSLYNGLSSAWTAISPGALESAEPTSSGLATQKLDCVGEQPLSGVEVKGELEAELTEYYAVPGRLEKLASDKLVLQAYMSVDSQGHVSVRDEIVTPDGFVLFFEAVLSETSHRKQGGLHKLLTKHAKSFFPKDSAAQLLGPKVVVSAGPASFSEVVQIPTDSHEMSIQAEGNEKSLEFVKVEVMEVYISMLTNYLWTKDGGKFGAYNVGHAERLTKAFKEHPEIGKVLSLVPVNVIVNGDVKHRLKVELSESASLEKTHVVAMYKALSEGHKSHGGFSNLMGGFDFIAAKQLVWDQSQLAQKVINATIGWYARWAQDGCTADTVEAFRSVLTHLQMTDVESQTPLEPSVVNSLIQAFGHEGEQMRKVERDVTKMQERYLPEVGNGGLPAIFKGLIGLSKSNDQSLGAVKGFGDGLTELGGKTVEMLRTALSKLNEEFGSEAVATQTMKQVNALLERASGSFKSSHPKWTNLYPNALSEENAELIQVSAREFNAKVQERVSASYMDAYMEVVKQGVDEFSCAAVDNNVKTKGLFPLLELVHTKLAAVPKLAMDKLDELGGIAAVDKDSVEVRKSTLQSELQAKLQDKFSAEVGLAVGRWIQKLEASGAMVDMQGRINDLEKRIPTLSEQLVKLNRQEFLGEDSRKVLKGKLSALVADDVTQSLRVPGFWEAISRGWKRSFDLRKSNVAAVIVGSAAAVGIGSQLPKAIRVPVVAIGSAIAALNWGVRGIFQSLGERRNAGKQIECITAAWTKIQSIAIGREEQV